MQWIEENKSKLQPPVGAELIFQEAQYSIMVVGGPNRRSDYHINETEVAALVAILTPQGILLSVER
jgi:hypothetical protein